MSQTDLFRETKPEPRSCGCQQTCERKAEWPVCRAFMVYYAPSARIVEGSFTATGKPGPNAVDRMARMGLLPVLGDYEALPDVREAPEHTGDDDA